MLFLSSISLDGFTFHKISVSSFCDLIDQKKFLDLIHCSIGERVDKMFAHCQAGKLASGRYTWSIVLVVSFTFLFILFILGSLLFAPPRAPHHPRLP